MYCARAALDPRRLLGYLALNLTTIAKENCQAGAIFENLPNEKSRIPFDAVIEFGLKIQRCIAAQCQTPKLSLDVSDLRLEHLRVNIEYCCLSLTETGF
jgi:hypothetical protein